MNDAAPQTLDHAGIARLIPHQGTMCLLERMQRWSQAELHCTAVGHVDPLHPLRTASGLLAPAAIEYAAQAMALHGALVAPAAQGARPGYLASVRGVRMRVRRLDAVEGALHIGVERLAGDSSLISYRFDVRNERGDSLVDGRATVVLNELP